MHCLVRNDRGKLNVAVKNAIRWDAAAPYFGRADATELGINPSKPQSLVKVRIGDKLVR